MCEYLERGLECRNAPMDGSRMCGCIKLAKVHKNVGTVEIKVNGYWKTFNPEQLFARNDPLLDEIAPVVRARLSRMVYGE